MPRLKTRRGKREKPLREVPEVVVRPARLADAPALLRLARILDSINLPPEPAELRLALRRSRRSFLGHAGKTSEAVYIFVAEERRRRRVVGSSMIIAKHGTPESPHFYLQMGSDERYSKTLRRMFRHTYLRLGHSMDGPTEVGGLVVDPRRRHHPARIGTQLSFVRFLYIALHRKRFGTQVIAEMKPPLTSTGESLFWQCYGARVTGLTFHQADRLSTKDKEFIPALFPDVPLYTYMLPLEVQEQLGQVGPDSAGAVRLLERIGLRFLEQIDPFDAGPYYGARLDDVTLIRSLRHARLVPDGREDPAQRSEFLVGVERRGFFAFRARGRLVEDVLFVSPRLLADLQLRPDSSVAILPFS